VNTYILGAGASYSYEQSPTGVRPPLATGFFSAYCSLDISGDIEVRVGDIVSYVASEYGIPYEDFCSFNQDAESFMTQLDQYVQDYVKMLQEAMLDGEKYGEFVNRIRAHDQMLLLFAHVLNEIQNGPVADIYLRLLNAVDISDPLVTFNWDTLLDRALQHSGNWSPINGYSVPFRALLDDDWFDLEDTILDIAESRLLLKLHGSTNWLVNYMTWNIQTGDRIMVSPADPKEGHTIISMDPKVLEAYVSGEYEGPEISEGSWQYSPPPKPDDDYAWPVLFVRSSKPFAAYKNRYRPGYEPYSYFFPPNDPHTDVPLIPLMVPPTKYKLYDEFSHVIDPLWEQAREGMLNSEKIYIIGYSLPETDHRSIDLVRDVAAKAGPNWIVVNPDPTPVCNRLIHSADVSEEMVEAEATTLSGYLGDIHSDS